MDFQNFVQRVHDYYVDQLRRFIEEQRAHCEKGAGEVKFQLNEQNELFDRFYCVDFIRNDDKPEVIELKPNFLSFEPITGSFGKASFRIDDMRWNDIIFEHDLPDIPYAEMKIWFEYWFDLEDHRHPGTGDLSNIIHSLLIEPGLVNVDFGSAEVDAFWGMLHLLEQAGAKSIWIRSSDTSSVNDSS